MTDRWRCAQCGCINEFLQPEPDICKQCKFDYMADVDEKLIDKVSFEVVTAAKD